MLHSSFLAHLPWDGSLKQKLVCFEAANPRISWSALRQLTQAQARLPRDILPKHKLICLETVYQSKSWPGDVVLVLFHTAYLVACAPSPIMLAFSCLQVLRPPVWLCRADAGQEQSDKSTLMQLQMHTLPISLRPRAGKSFLSISKKRILWRLKLKPEPSNSPSPSIAKGSTAKLVAVQLRLAFCRAQVHEPTNNC